jgi:AcrR family transcriptional regulator
MSASVTPRAGSKSPRHRERAAHLGPERRRPLVLDAAFALFLEHGYDGTSMEAVAGAAGVTKPVVYDCFASKEELFTALLRREETRVLGQIAAALPREAAGGDAERLLGDALTAFLRAVADSPQAYRVIFLGEGGANAAVARHIRTGRREQVRVITVLVSEWLRRHRPGIAAESAAPLVAHALVGVAEGAARALLTEDGAWTPESLGRALGALAAGGLPALEQSSVVSHQSSVPRART